MPEIAAKNESEFIVDLFSIEYRVGGEVVRKRVKGHKMARSIARSLAKSSGNRVIVRRVRSENEGWQIYLVDVAGGVTHLLAKDMEKVVASQFFMSWKARKNQAVVVMWPSWAGKPRIKFADAAYVRH